MLKWLEIENHRDFSLQKLEVGHTDDGRNPAPVDM